MSFYVFCTYFSLIFLFALNCDVLSVNHCFNCVYTYIHTYAYTACVLSMYRPVRIAAYVHAMCEFFYTYVCKSKNANDTTSAMFWTVIVLHS